MSSAPTGEDAKVAKRKKGLAGDMIRGLRCQRKSGRVGVAYMRGYWTRERGQG